MGICRKVDFAVPTNHKVKIIESKKRDKSSNLTGELRKLWNIRVTVIPVIIGALGAVPQSLERGWKRWKSKDESRPSKLQHC